MLLSYFPCNKMFDRPFLVNCPLPITFHKCQQQTDGVFLWLLQRGKHHESFSVCLYGFHMNRNQNYVLQSEMCYATITDWSNTLVNQQSQNRSDRDRTAVHQQSEIYKSTVNAYTNWKIQALLNETEKKNWGKWINSQRQRHVNQQ